MQEKILQVLKKINLPDGSQDLVSLNLVKDIVIKDDKNIKIQ